MFFKFTFKEASLFKYGISGENQRDLYQIDRKLEADVEGLYLRQPVWIRDSITLNLEHSFLRLAFPSVYPSPHPQKPLKDLGFAVMSKRKLFKNFILWEWNHLPINFAHAK